MFNKLIYWIFIYPVYKIRLGSIGRRTKLIRSFVAGHKNIHIGSNVFIRIHTWLAAEPLTNSPECILKIGDGTYIGRFCHIYASMKIEIGKKVLVADKVYISDNMHDYRQIDKPIIEQSIIQRSAVIIGDGAWLGENVCVIGASVGKNSVVGANSVVMKDIPDYCVAVGSPATIIKRYNFSSRIWQKTDKDGNFIN